LVLSFFLYAFDCAVYIWNPEQCSWLFKIVIRQKVTLYMSKIQNSPQTQYQKTSSKVLSQYTRQGLSVLNQTEEPTIFRLGF